MSKNKIYFHIIGAGRGGTSLLAGLLDYHSMLEVGFEKFSVAYLMGKKLRHHNTDVFHQRVTTYISACKRTARWHPTRLWGNKITTEQVFGLEDHNIANPESKINILDMFFNQHLENTKIIFVLRDGRTCINSKVQRTGQTYKTACQRWMDSVSCYKFFKENHKNNLLVRFEDILEKPQETLLQICNFLEIPYQEKMLNGTRNKKMLPEYQKKGLDVSKLKNIDFPLEYLSQIEDDLKYCGYL